MSEPTDNRERVLGLLRRYGQNTCSFQALERGLSYWFDGDDACVAYADTGGAWIAAGEPICADERIEPVARRFCAAARERGRRPRFFALEREVGDDIARLHIGMQPVWNPQDWPDTLRGKRSLR
ncbi:MAG: DUF2156 domain-containing protein, partial [Deltaproteobacteria bacterium]|nr:DUF2156 domain-containing protein [Deltaproteobacteria bacterium]